MKINSLNRAIRFQILSELSAWNGFVCSPELKKEWTSLSGGPLNKKEKLALRNLSDALRNGPDDAWFFFLCSTTKKIKEKIGAESYTDIISAIKGCEEVLRPRIDIIISKYHQQNIKSKLLFKKLLSKSVKYFKLLEDFTDSQSVKNFSIYIELPKVVGFEAWAFGGSKIIIFPPKNNKYNLLLKTIVHEYGHLLARNNNKLAKSIERIANDASSESLNKLANKVGLPPHIIVEELFFSSIIPEGFMGYLIDKKEWPLSSKASVFEKKRIKFANIMRPFVKQRIENIVTIQEFLLIFEKELISYIN